MKSILLSFIAFLSLTTFVSAQKIAGTIEDVAGTPLDFATVLLHSAQDSSLVKGTVTGANGAYEFVSISSGRYYIKASMLGVGKYESKAFELNGSDLVMDKITLQEDTKTLSQVTVVARRPVVEVKADKTVLNVEGTVNSTGLSALELLRKAPGVTVDNNENVNVKGKNQVKVMIDGRDVPLDGKDLTALLKSTQAGDIATIEIISNPSAKFDAAGNAGIINIRMRKNKAHGTNGNVGLEAIYGESAKGGGNLSLNHREKKVNVFGSYNNHYGDWHNTNTFVREQDGSVFDQKTKQYSQSKWNSMRAGADFFLNDKNTLGVLVNGSSNTGGWFSNSRAMISQIENRAKIDSFLIASNDQTNNRKDLNVNLNYRFADTSGHSLNIDLDRGVYRIQGTSFQPNFYKSPDEGEIYSQRIYRNSTPTNIDILTGKADYEMQFLKGTLGIGTKISDVKTDNTFDFFNVFGSQTVLDTTASNQFVYKERTTAGYVNYNRKFGTKLNVQAGLRVENTDYMGDLITMTAQSGQRVADNYTELFPSAAVTYSFTDKIGLNATYSRRIDRPSYQDLNPFENKLDELTFQKGNPRLRPQFTNSFELAPTYQGFPVISLGYSHTNDVFTQILKVDDRNPRATFITQENLAEQTNYTASLNFPTPLAKWWEGFVSLTAMRSHFNADFGNDFKVDKAFNAFNLYAEQTVRLPKGFSVQLSGWYNSPSFWGTLSSEQQGALDFGVKKKILKDKGELRLRVGDILGTAGWSGENLFTPNLKMLASGTWESQTVTLNFSYRFGSNEVKGERQRKTGLEDESRRVKGRG